MNNPMPQQQYTTSQNWNYYQMAPPPADFQQNACVQQFTAYQTQPLQAISIHTFIPQQCVPFNTSSFHAPLQGPQRVKQHNPYAQTTPTMTPTNPQPTTGFSDDSLNGSMEIGVSGVRTPSSEFSYSHLSSPQLAPHPTSRNRSFNFSPQLVTQEELLAQQGNLVDLARTAAGSSFIQSAIRDGTTDSQANLQLVGIELIPAIGDLLLDAHGCYVVKSFMEKLPLNQLHALISALSVDESLLFSMCTHSLHTRRVVQFLIDCVDIHFLAPILVTRCDEISTTQQGCIVMQRAMDVAKGPVKYSLFSVIYQNLLQFAVDPFANYVVQHMLEVGDKEENSVAVHRAFHGHIFELSCNKFASNVIEKCMFHLCPEAQHEILMEMYNVPEETLHLMIQDSFGNYIIQSSIALAAFKDVFFISEKLKLVLQRTPYGHKIEARLERRLKGKPVGTRSPQIGANSKQQSHQQNNYNNLHQNAPSAVSTSDNSPPRPPPRVANFTKEAADEVVEEPW